MTRNVLPLTRILAIISIIALVLVLPACAEAAVVDNTVDMTTVEDIGDLTDVEDVTEEDVTEEDVSEEDATEEDVSDEEVDETSEIEVIEITADSGAVYEVPAATPLGRLAAAALEEDGFEYVVSDELFESEGTLTLVSIEEYVSGEAGTWEVYENIDGEDTLIPNDELGTFITVGDLSFVYVDEDGEAITALVISTAEEVTDEEVADEESDEEVTDEESDETEAEDSAADVESEDEDDSELSDE